MFKCIFMAEKIIADTDFMNNVNRQGLVVDRNAPYYVFNHAGKFVIHHQLAVINCHAHFNHTQAVNQVGTCQRR